jgi:hypothetical protein
MQVMMKAAVAAGLLGLAAAATPLRADEDCDNVIKALNEAVSIASKSFDTTMDELKQAMSQGPADDKKKASVKNTFCSAVGEFLGTSRASRAVAAECGASQRAALAQFDKSIREIETAIENTCK